MRGIVSGLVLLLGLILVQVVISARGRGSTSSTVSRLANRLGRVVVGNNDKDSSQSASSLRERQREDEARRAKAEDLRDIARRRAQRGLSPSLSNEAVLRSENAYSSSAQYMRYIMEQEGDSPMERVGRGRTLGTVNSGDDDVPLKVDDDMVSDALKEELCYVPSPSWVTYNFTCMANTAVVPPQCLQNVSDLVYDDAGQLSAVQTFYNCLANIYDAAEPATFYNGSYNGCLTIYTIMTVLNLVKVSEFYCSICEHLSIYEAIVTESSTVLSVINWMYFSILVD